MMKMHIEMDENKILRDGKYDIGKINSYLDKAFAKRDMTKDSDDWYSNGFRY